jgi:cytochrome c oxidase subunit 2
MPNPLTDIVPAAGSSVLAAAAGGDGPGWWTRLWFREGASTFVPSSDAIYYFIFWVSAFFFVLICGCMVLFGLKYRRSRVGNVAEVSSSHNNALELTWSVIPAIGFAVMFFWGFHAYLKKIVAPVDAIEINAQAYQWGWDFTYPGGVSTISQVSWDPETNTNRAAFDIPLIAVPQGRPVKVILNSRDVIHSFYVPAFRIKRDVFPNRYTTLWFETTGRPTHIWSETDKALVPEDVSKPGYYLFCAEYCGDNHSQMAARIAVVDDYSYNKWLDAQTDTTNIPPVKLGEILYTVKGCAQCHTIDADKPEKIGPTWDGAWGGERPGWEAPEGSDAEDGRAGWEYMRQAILDPRVYVKPGYVNGMQSYQGQLTERELFSLLVYIKSLTDEYREEAIAQSEAAMEAQEEGEAGEGEGEGDANGEDAAEPADAAADSSP